MELLKRAISIGAILFANSLFALEHPSHCPSTQAIKSEGLTIAYQLINLYFGAYQFSQYDTDKTWLFGLGLVKSSNQSDALVQGNKLLTKLSGRPVPELDHAQNWACYYRVGDNKYEAVAIQTDFVDTPIEFETSFAHR